MNVCTTLPSSLAGRLGLREPFPRGPRPSWEAPRSKHPPNTVCAAGEALSRPVPAACPAPCPPALLSLDEHLPAPSPAEGASTALVQLINPLLKKKSNQRPIFLMGSAGRTLNKAQLLRVATRPCVFPV